MQRYEMVRTSTADLYGRLYFFVHHFFYVSNFGGGMDTLEWLNIGIHAVLTFGFWAWLAYDLLTKK